MRLIETNRLRNYILLIFAEIIGGLFITGLSILFQYKTTFQSIMDAFMIAGIVMGSFSWILLLSCIGVYETIEFSFKFIASKIKREPFELTFYEFVSLRDKTDAMSYKSMLFTSFLFLLTGSIMYYIYYTQMMV